jgi:hypothetical protein
MILLPVEKQSDEQIMSERKDKKKKPEKDTLPAEIRLIGILLCYLSSLSFADLATHTH